MGNGPKQLVRCDTAGALLLVSMILSVLASLSACGRSDLSKPLHGTWTNQQTIQDRLLLRGNHTMLDPRFEGNPDGGKIRLMATQTEGNAVAIAGDLKEQAMGHR